VHKILTIDMIGLLPSQTKAMLPFALMQKQTQKQCRCGNCFPLWL